MIDAYGILIFLEDDKKQDGEYLFLVKVVCIVK